MDVVCWVIMDNVEQNEAGWFVWEGRAFYPSPPYTKPAKPGATYPSSLDYFSKSVSWRRY